MRLILASNKRAEHHFFMLYGIMLSAGTSFKCSLLVYLFVLFFLFPLMLFFGASSIYLEQPCEQSSSKGYKNVCNEQTRSNLVFIRLACSLLTKLSFQSRPVCCFGFNGLFRLYLAVSQKECRKET